MRQLLDMPPSHNTGTQGAAREVTHFRTIFGSYSDHFRTISGPFLPILSRQGHREFPELFAIFLVSAPQEELERLLALSQQKVVSAHQWTSEVQRDADALSARLRGMRRRFARHVSVACAR